ncbi:MAG: transposase [Rubrivivax sp.]|jgi:IS5 family transposase|nr:transposase [Rubrivivax sp.]
MAEELDFFRCRLDQMIDLRLPLAVLASRLPWQALEASIAHAFAKKVRSGKRIDDVDLFGPVSGEVTARVSAAGRPRLPLRLMISLRYLKHAFNESDEGVVERWSETPTWQYFSGLAYFEHRWPCDPSLLVRFRRALGEKCVEAPLSKTIQVALQLKLIARKDLATVIVNST